MKEEFPNLPILAAVNPSQGVEKPPVMEVTTSFGDVLSSLVHGRVGEEQRASLNRMLFAGNIVPYAEGLGYQAILWGPLEEITWGENTKHRFINERKLLARHGSVSLYYLSDEYRRDFEAEAQRPAHAHANFARKLAAGGWTLEALEHYHQAVALEPNRVKWHYELGTVLFRLGSFEAAEDELDEALRLDPNYAPARAILVALKLKAKSDLHRDGRQ